MQDPPGGGDAADDDDELFVGAAAIAFQAQRRNLLRSALTMLGVIIGVAAVIAMIIGIYIMTCGAP